MNLYGEKVILRAIEERDCEVLRQMMNDPEIEHLVVGWSFPVSEYAQKQWYQNHGNDNLLSSGVQRFVIANNEDNALGLLVLSDFDWKNRSVQIGIKILSVENRAKGIATDTYLTAMRYIFDELQMHRLEARYNEYNAASSALHKKLGFKVEGLLRHISYKKGSYHNVYITSILADEYHEMISKRESSDN